MMRIKFSNENQPVFSAKQKKNSRYRERGKKLMLKCATIYFGFCSTKFSIFFREKIFSYFSVINYLYFFRQVDDLYLDFPILKIIMLTSLNKYNNKMTIEQTIDRLVIVDLLRKSRKKG